jgi:hypothetical protein
LQSIKFIGRVIHRLAEAKTKPGGTTRELGVKQERAAVHSRG